MYNSCQMAARPAVSRRPAGATPRHCCAAGNDQPRSSVQPPPLHPACMDVSPTAQHSPPCRGAPQPRHQPQPGHTPRSARALLTPLVLLLTPPVRLHQQRKAVQAHETTAAAQTRPATHYTTRPTGAARRSLHRHAPAGSRRRGTPRGHPDAPSRTPYTSIRCLTSALQAAAVQASRPTTASSPQLQHQPEAPLQEAATRPASEPAQRTSHQLGPASGHYKK